MTGRLGVGLLGVGWMGVLHTRSYRRLGDHYPEMGVEIDLVAAADVSEVGRRKAVEQLGFGRAVEDWRVVVDDPAVDVVSVTAPNAFHREMALAVIAAGKGLWIEKPLGRNVAETEDVAKAAAEVGTICAVGFNYRNVPLVEHTRALISAGALGRLTGFRGWFLNDYASDPWGTINWRFRRAEAGSGALGDLMSHVIDLAAYLVGPLEELVASTDVVIEDRPLPSEGSDGDHFGTSRPGREPPGPDVPVEAVDNEDAARALVRFAGGVPGFLEAGRAVVGPHCSLGFVVHGTRGSVSWDFERMNELALYRTDGDGDVGYQRVLARPGHGEYGRFQPGPAIALGYDDLKVIEAARFVGAFRAGRPCVPGLAEALAAARAIDAMERSAASRMWEGVG